MRPHDFKTTEKDDGDVPQRVQNDTLGVSPLLASVVPGVNTGYNVIFEKSLAFSRIAARSCTRTAALC